LALGIRSYRETYFKPYRIISEVSARQVYIYLIADGRRDMQNALAKAPAAPLIKASRIRNPPAAH
jgi:toxin ParE1/3/4